jgi:hypothetical protein
LKSFRQRLTSKKLRRPSISSPQEWYRKRKQRLREENEKQRALEPTSLKLLTSGVTFVSMVLSLSFIPLFPQPLPVLIAFLIAFGAFQKPQYSMPVGALLIGLGMIYHLASMNFIAMLGPLEARVLFIAVLLYFFVALPIRFHSCEDAIAINIGIMAASLLFFTQTYIFAVPLLLTVAVLFKKTQGGLALSYYVMISVPLQIMQFSELIRTITRTEWWLDPLGVPPLFVSLNGIFKDMQDSMTQFRLFDSSKVVGVISSQITSSPPASASVVGSALSQYLDSFPGIILFLTLVLSLIFAISTIAPEFTKKSYALRMEVLLSALSAAGITAMFFLLAIAMQSPLAFRAQINTAQIATGVLVTILIALPLSYVNYAPKKRALIEERSKRVMAKAQELTGKLQAFETLMGKSKLIPADVSSPEGKMLLIKDRLNEIIAKTTAKLYDPSELDDTFSEMNKKIGVEIESLFPELGKVLEEYQLQVNYEYTVWLKKLKSLGFEPKTVVKADFQKDMPLEARIDNIREVLENSRVLANEVSQTVEQTYGIIRMLYDPSLPEQSRTIFFVKQQLAENVAPWFATNVLFTAITSWKMLYGKDVSKSVEYLLTSLDALISLDTPRENLQPALGKHYPGVADCITRAEDLKRSIENKTITVVDLAFIKNAVETSLNISKDVLSTLYELMETKEASIENLLPIREAFWEKNISLKEQTASAIKIIVDAPKQELNKTMAALPKTLSQLHICIDTLVVYSEKEELLLNYPVAKTAIEDLLKQKKRVSALDLPFDARYAEEYLRLFYISQTKNAFSYDEANLTLVKKA